MGTQSYGNQDMVVVQYDLNGNKIRTLQYGNVVQTPVLPLPVKPVLSKFTGQQPAISGAALPRGQLIYSRLFTISTGDRGQYPSWHWRCRPRHRCCW